MVEFEVNRSIDMLNTINTAITNWSSDGRTQLYDEKKQILFFCFLFIRLFIFYLNSNELYKKLFENDKNTFEAELGN